MIRNAYAVMCAGWPYPNVVPNVVSALPHHESLFGPAMPAIVAGKSSRLDAKIGGITPDMLSLNGRCVLWPAYMRRPTCFLA